ncbi:hypothetical protein EI94DRAFT_1704730 [Lactarius quietus]|nr:hypothetical protein EI94DRAFT_1704730 [Lactarius quietus]
MQSLLQIAFQVEAAIEAYNSVKPIPNLEEWVQHIEEEKSSVCLFRDLRDANGGAAPALHPTLAALFMETFDCPQLSDINLPSSPIYCPPPEIFGETLLACQGKEVLPLDRPLLRVRLTLPPAPISKEMEVDELTADNFILPIQIPKQGKSTTAEASTSKKQKGALLLEPAVVKQRAGSSWQQPLSAEDYKFQENSARDVKMPARTMGKCPACRNGLKDLLGSGASPSTMLSALELDSPSSCSPKALEPPATAAAQAPSAAFVAEVLPSPKKTHMPLLIPCVSTPQDSATLSAVALPPPPATAHASAHGHTEMGQPLATTSDKLGVAELYNANLVHTCQGDTDAPAWLMNLNASLNWQWKQFHAHVLHNMEEIACLSAEMRLGPLTAPLPGFMGHSWAFIYIEAQMYEKEATGTAVPTSLSQKLGQKLWFLS